jgi:protein DJ-1
MSPKALVIMAEGAEDMETVIVVNILRRGNIDVTLASLSDEGSSSPVTCSRSIKIMPDCSLKEAWNEGKAKFDAVVLPGNFV